MTMGDKSKIEWTDATWNVLRGCSRVSEGCRNCYAEQIAARFSDPGAPFHGLAERTKAGGRWTGKVAFVDSLLTQPLRWSKPRAIFVNSVSDLFHESVPDEWIDRVFAVMALAPQHTFIVLTKRAKRMREYINALSRNADRDRANELPAVWQMRLANAHAPGTLPITKDDVYRRLGLSVKFSYDPPTPLWPLPNVILGVSAERQQEADERVSDLAATPAAKRIVSAEPLLGSIDFTEIAVTGTLGEEPALACLDAIIVGGESGKGARPMQVEWARSIVQQCRAAGVACFVKQLGAEPVWEDGAFLNLKDRKGGDPTEWPEDLRVQQLPWELSK